MNRRLVILITALGAAPGCFAQLTDNSASDGVVAAPTHKTGSYTERTTLVSLVGEVGAQRYADSFAPGHEFEFGVYVPENYDPSTPSGLIVYVSPIASGAMPDPWQEVFDRRNLIWVSVNNSGNTMPAEQRLAEAKLSSVFISGNYEINPQRTYISGMSGGGQIATIASSIDPDLFKGGIFLCGVNPWSERDPDPWAQDPPEHLDTIKNNRYVFVSGTEDFKLAAVARAYRLFRKAGIENSKLIVIEDMGHELPNTDIFDRALGFLDSHSAVAEKTE